MAKNSELLREGQIWSYNKSTNTRVEYEIRNIREVGDRRVCEIHKVGDISCNKEYEVKFFDDSTYKWRLEKDILKECPECGNEAPIADNDFICVDCRGKVMVTGRLVADVDSQMTITTFTGNKEEITFSPEGSKSFTVKREDMPQSVLVALKTFVESND